MSRLKIMISALDEYKFIVEIISAVNIITVVNINIGGICLSFY